MILGTLIPQAASDAGEVARWAQEHRALEAIVAPLGLHSAYSQPVFLAIMAMLAASTAACAWERTARAVRLWRARGTVTPAQVARLRAADPIALLPDEETSPDRALERAAHALRGLGLRPVSGTRVLEASSGSWGLAGSPVFHWALVLLLVMVPLGRLTRAEGLMGVVAGTARVDEESSYGRLNMGPLHRELTGLEIGVEPGFPLNLKEGDVERGPAPTVTLASGGQLVARQQVVPNRPLRWRSITIHFSDLGAGMAYSLVTTDGVVLSDQALIDPDESQPSGYTTFGATYDNAAGEVVADITVEFPPDGVEVPDDSGGGHHLYVRATGPAGDRVERLVKSGDEIDLGAGLRLRADVVDHYVRLSVVDDWTVNWIYALFLLALAAVSVSVLVPHRIVRVLLDTSGEVPVLRVVVSHSRKSPEFERRVREALGYSETEEA